MLFFGPVVLLSYYWLSYSLFTSSFLNDSFSAPSFRRCFFQINKMLNAWAMEDLIFCTITRWKCLQIPSSGLFRCSVATTPSSCQISKYLQNSRWCLHTEHGEHQHVNICHCKHVSMLMLAFSSKHHRAASMAVDCRRSYCTIVFRPWLAPLFLLFCCRTTISIHTALKICDILTVKNSQQYVTETQTVIFLHTADGNWRLVTPVSRWP